MEKGIIKAGEASAVLVAEVSEEHKANRALLLKNKAKAKRAAVALLKLVLDVEPPKDLADYRFKFGGIFRGLNPAEQIAAIRSVVRFFHSVGFEVELTENKFPYIVRVVDGEVFELGLMNSEARKALAKELQA